MDETSMKTTSSETIRDAEEVIIFMHRNFRVSRNVRAHWFFDHIGKTVEIQDTPADDEYSKEMVVVGIVAKGGSPEQLVKGEQFRVCTDTKITYISNFYRHVFLLDLSPSAIVADDEANCCLHTKLLECLQLSMLSVTRKFTIPGTQQLFQPQIYASVCVYVPFLGFEEDLVLEQGVLLIEGNAEEVYARVEKRFQDVLRALHTFSSPILRKWGEVKRRHRNKYDSTCDFDNDEYDINEILNGGSLEDSVCSSPRPFAVGSLAERDVGRNDGYGIREYSTRYWQTRSLMHKEEDTCNVHKEGYILPEWSLVFMLRLGLIAIQMLPENTQSNVIVITDSVCGMPDAVALQKLLTQIRSYTVSCSFIQVQGRSRSETSFGHVASCELLHFLAMATFGAYIPNCRCSIGVPVDNPDGQVSEQIEDCHRHLNPFHRALICWCFQNALQENEHIKKLVDEMNPEFARLCRSTTTEIEDMVTIRQSTLHDILYVRLREGFTLKQLEVCEGGRMRIRLAMPFRPLVFIQYLITCSWPVQRRREAISVQVVVTGPQSELLRPTFINPTRKKIFDTLDATVNSIKEADVLLLHMHSFNTDAHFYSIPSGVSSKYPMFRTEDAALAAISGRVEETLNKFLAFWSRLCGLNDAAWQKWVHMHLERLVLKSDGLPTRIFSGNVKMSCMESWTALHDLLKHRSSFCLVHNQLYVTFVFGTNGDVPTYFYLTRVSRSPPAVVLKMAFLGGISSAERRTIVHSMRRSLVGLTVLPAEGSIATVVRRPLERILVRYQSVPADLRMLVRFGPQDRGESVRNLTLHNAVAKYLQGRRRVWSLLTTSVLDYDDQDNLNTTAQYILTMLMARRMHEGYHVVWSSHGAVGFCRLIKKEDGGDSLEQFVTLPPAEPQHLLGARDDVLRVPHRVGTKSDETPAQRVMLVTEIWKEPCAPEDVQHRWFRDEDDDLVSVLFSLDQLFRLCTTDNDHLVRVCLPPPVLDENGVEIVNRGNGTKIICDPAKPQVGRRVSVRDNVFDLLLLMDCSERHLILVPTFETADNTEVRRLRYLHQWMLAELALFYDSFFDVDDSRFWSYCLRNAQVQDKQTIADFDRVKNVPCRVFVRRVNHWILNALVVPLQCKTLMQMDSCCVPMVFCVMNEPWISQCLVREQAFERVRVHDYRDGYFPPTVRIPTISDSSRRQPDLEFFSDCRGHDYPWFREYMAVPAETLIDDLFSLVLDRTRLHCMYSAVINGISMPSEAVESVMDEQSEGSIRIELPRVAQSLNASCRHLHPLNGNEAAVDDKEEAEEEWCCGEWKLTEVFRRVVHKHFTEMDQSPSYFFLSNPYQSIRQRRKAARKATIVETDEMESITSSFMDTGDIGIEADEFIDAERICLKGISFHDHSQKNANIQEDLLVTLPRASEQRRLRRRILLNSTHWLRKRMFTDDRGRSTVISEPREPWMTRGTQRQPLFIYFLVSVKFPGGHMETIAIDFLPSCIHQLLDRCDYRPNELEMCKMEAAMELYVVPSGSAEEDIRKELILFQNRKLGGTRDSVSSSDCEHDGEDLMPSTREGQRKEKRLRRMPLVRDLLQWVNRVLEQESVMTLSKRGTLGTKEIDKVVHFIEKEEKSRNQCCDVSISTRLLQLVACNDDIMEKLLKRLDGYKLEYTTLRRLDSSNWFYACEIDDMTRFLQINQHNKSTEQMQAFRYMNDDNQDNDVEDVHSERARSPPHRHHPPMRAFSYDSQMISHMDDLDKHLDSLAMGNVANGREVRAEEMSDFWIVLKVDNDIDISKKHITVYFCQRNVVVSEMESPKASEDRRPPAFLHRKIRDFLLEKSREIIRQVNQEVLLDEMYELRTCRSAMLSVEDDEFDKSGNMSEEAVASAVRTIQRFAFAPGKFACDPMDVLWYKIHPRVTHRSRIYNIIKDYLEQFSVTNMKNTYVVKEKTGNVLYMQLYDTVEPFMEALKNAGQGDKRKRLILEPCFKDHVLLAIYGVHKPGNDIMVDLKRDIQRRVDDCVLAYLCDFLTKNSSGRLAPDDIKFIQPRACEPSKVFLFSIPMAHADHLFALNYYLQQHLEVAFPLAQYRDRESATGTGCFLSFDSARRRSDEPQRFFIYNQPGQMGLRSIGVACMELSIRVAPYGDEAAVLTHGRLNMSAHSIFALHVPDKRSRQQAYRDLTHTTSVTRDDCQKGIPALVRAVIWQAGDVGLVELCELLQRIVEQALCDVATEFGLLNLEKGVIERGQYVPTSPAPFVSPSSKVMVTPTSAAPRVAAASIERRQTLRKRDSSEAANHPSGGIIRNLLPSTPIQTKDQEMPDFSAERFTFDTSRRGSTASELVDFQHFGSSGSFGRGPEHANSKFVGMAGDWFEHVLDVSGEGGVAVSRFQWELDCRHSVSKTLKVVSEGIAAKLQEKGNPLSERVALCELSTRGRGDGRYEVVSPSWDPVFSADLGYQIEHAEEASLLVIAIPHNVEVESRRYGMDSTGDPPELLKDLGQGKYGSFTFVPNTYPFVPRQRILFGIVCGTRLTFYLYNFSQPMTTEIRNIVERTTQWHNAKTRLLREIGLHKMGITHLSPLEAEDKAPYQYLTWRDPMKLMDNDSPPLGDLNVVALGGFSPAVASRLFRLYRGLNPCTLETAYYLSECLIKFQQDQLRLVRGEMQQLLERAWCYRTVCSSLESGCTEVEYQHVHRLLTYSRKVHFVQTPILLFPRWRKKIAEVRGCRADVPSEFGGRSRHSSSEHHESGSGRLRSNTMSSSGDYLVLPPGTPGPMLRDSGATGGGGSFTHCSRTPSDQDPCQMKILYMLLGEYMEYIKKLGLDAFKVYSWVPVCSKVRGQGSVKEFEHSTEFDPKKRVEPHVYMYKLTKGGLVMVKLSFVEPYFTMYIGTCSRHTMAYCSDTDDSEERALLNELELAKDEIVTRCHIHSFTYDFHLRIMSRFLVGKEEVLFNPGYNTPAFLVDFLKYYGCRPPSARNCVYEDRPSFILQHGVTGEQIWRHFLSSSSEKLYSWSVIKLKNTDEEKDGDNGRQVDYMIVSTEVVQLAHGSRELLRVVLRDRRRVEDTGTLNLTVYLILITSDFAIPLDEERQREGSRGGADKGEFLNVALDTQIDQMMAECFKGNMPSVETGFVRRRFASGTTLSALPANTSTGVNTTDAEGVVSGTSRQTTAASEDGGTHMKATGSDSDVARAVAAEQQQRLSVQHGSTSRRHRRNYHNSDDGQIPGERITYVQFLSSRQRRLQSEVESSMLEFGLRLRKAIYDAELACRRNNLWDTVFRLPPSVKTPVKYINDPVWDRLGCISSENTHDLDILLTLTTLVDMSSMEPRLASLLQGLSAVRLCCFLYNKFEYQRCRLFEYPNSEKKCFLVTNPDSYDSSAFVVKVEGPTNMNLYVLIKETDDDNKLANNKHWQARWDKQLNEVVACVAAFLWKDLLLMPPKEPK